MVVKGSEGVALRVHFGSASPADVKLSSRALDNIKVGLRQPVRLVTSRGYDGDPLRAQLRARGIELIVPNRRNHCKTQNRRRLRRYKR